MENLTEWATILGDTGTLDYLHCRQGFCILFHAFQNERRVVAGTVKR